MANRRQRRTITTMGGRYDIPVGAHACCWFDDPLQRRTVARAFITAGLERGERVAVYVSDGAAPLVDATEPEVARLIDRGQLVVGSAEAAYFPDGSFDGPQRAADFAAFAAETAAAGYPALRVYADNGRMPGLLPSPDAWLEYEVRVAATIPRYPLIGLCGFSAADRPRLPMGLVDAVHEHNITPRAQRTGFHVHGNQDGSLTVAGQVERLVLDELRRVIAAARPVFTETVVSLRGVTFADGAAAVELYQLTQAPDLTVVDVPSSLRRVWTVLGLTAA